jgi:hypothetical protein
MSDHRDQLLARARTERFIDGVEHWIVAHDG